MIRTLIVDDEPLARRELARLIAGNPEFKVIGEAANGEEALAKIKKEKPDVLFLDIEMPGRSGLEIASDLARFEDPPLVIFATAYHRYAIEAFEAHAMDYILKPFEPSRISKTLQRIKELLSGKTGRRQQLVSLEKDLIKKGLLKKLTGHKRNSKDRLVLDPGEVFYFQAKNAEIFAYVETQELIVNSTLKDLLKSLDPLKFAQTHKAYIVNLDKIEKVSPMFSGNFVITLKTPSKLPLIPLSRRYAANLKSRLGNW